MKKLIIFLLLFSFNANAACDWKTGITPGANKTFTYTEDCHQLVGATVQANKDLNQAIDLKNLAIKDADSRTALWMSTANSEQGRLDKLNSDQKVNDFLYFGLGILTSVGVGLMTARLIGR